MPRSPEAYVDTSALIAFADRSATHHLLFRRLFSDPPALLTSALVVAEGHAWFLRRYAIHRALQFLAMIDEMKFLSAAAVGRHELAGASMLLRRLSDQVLTLTYALGLYLMKERNMGTCWSTDFHLGLTGATLVVNAPR
jgi:predicted nucleic acid-binding protein